MKTYNAALQAQLDAYLSEQSGLPQSKAAAMIGVSPTALSQYRNSKYPGDVEAVESKIEEFLRTRSAAAQAEAEKAPYLSAGYVPTSVSEDVCSTYQIRKIYAIGQALGIVNRGGEDALHDLVYGVTGKSSVKELSYSEACKVIGELEARQGTPPPRPKKTNHRKRKPGGVSEGQERKVWALMYRLAAASPSTVAVGDRLRAAIKKEAGVDAFADDPFAWLDYKSCNKLIEALKGYVKNAERKAGAADG